MHRPYREETLASRGNMREDFGRELRKRRQQAKLTVREVAAAANCSPGTVTKIEKGHRQASADMARVLDTALAAGGALQALAEPAPAPRQDHPATPATASANLILPWTVAGGLQAVSVVYQADQVDRRKFITLVGPALTTPAHEWLIAAAAGDATSTAGHPLPDAIVDHLDTITAGLRRVDDHLGGQTLDLVRQHLGAVVRLLKHRHYTDQVGRRLHAAAGELARLAGFSSAERVFA